MEAPEPQAAAEQPPEDMYEVPVDGETQKVSLQELKDGYTRRASFTQKSQQLAAEREAFNAERAASLTGRSPGLGVGPPGPYDPWGFPAAAPAVQVPSGPAEQAAAGITAGEPAVRSAPAYPAADDDVVTRAEMAEVQRIAVENRRMAAQNQEMYERFERQQDEQRAMGSLQARHADFNEQACMEHYYRLPHAEQARLKAMPRSVAMELIHLQTRQNPAPQAQPKGEAKPPKVPYSEPSRNVPDAGTSSAAATEKAPPLSDRQATGAWWLKAIDAEPTRR